MYKPDYFNIKELISQKTYNTHKEFAWRFFDEDILKDLDFIREQWGSPVLINNWSMGGHYHESGLRTNMDSIVQKKKYPYCSGHVMGKAFDLKPIEGSYRDLYNFTRVLLQEGKLNAFKRLESIEQTPGWIHIDSLRINGELYEIF